MFGMPDKILTNHVLLATSTETRPRGRPRTRWRDHLSDLTWFRPGAEPSELPEIAENRQVGGSSPSYDCCSRDPPQRKSTKMNELTAAILRLHLLLSGVNRSGRTSYLLDTGLLRPFDRGGLPPFRSGRSKSGSRSLLTSWESDCSWTSRTKTSG